MNAVKTIIERAIALAQTYYPLASGLAPFVQGIAAGILHTDPAPTNADGSAMTPEQVDAYRAAVMAGVDRVLSKVDGLLQMAADERAKAIADAALEAPPAA